MCERSPACWDAASCNAEASSWEGATSCAGPRTRSWDISRPSGARSPATPDASTRDEVHAFLDDLSPPRPDARAFRRFKEHRLHRVSLGIESGDPSIRRLYGKSWADEDLADVVADIKGAGLALSLVVLAGAGGEENAEAHVEATADLITSLALGRGDIVALLDAEEVRDPRGGGSRPRRVSPP